jgi:hypothetical protein
MSHDEFMSIDPLTINRIAIINDIATKRIFGIDSEFGSVAIETRDEAIARVKSMPEGHKKRNYMQIYGLRGFSH